MDPNEFDRLIAASSPDNTNAENAYYLQGVELRKAYGNELEMIAWSLSEFTNLQNSTTKSFVIENLPFQYQINFNNLSNEFNDLARTFLFETVIPFYDSFDSKTQIKLADAQSWYVIRLFDTWPDFFQALWGFANDQMKSIFLFKFFGNLGYPTPFDIITFHQIRESLNYEEILGYIYNQMAASNVYGFWALAGLSTYGGSLWIANEAIASALTSADTPMLPGVLIVLRFLIRCTDPETRVSIYENWSLPSFIETGINDGNIDSVKEAMELAVTCGRYINGIEETIIEVCLALIRSENTSVADGVTAYLYNIVTQTEFTGEILEAVITALSEFYEREPFPGRGMFVDRLAQIAIQCFAKNVELSSELFNSLVDDNLLNNFPLAAALITIMNRCLMFDITAPMQAPLEALFPVLIEYQDPISYQIFPLIYWFYKLPISPKLILNFFKDNIATLYANVLYFVQLEGSDEGVSKSFQDLQYQYIKRYSQDIECNISQIISGFEDFTYENISIIAQIIGYAPEDQYIQLYDTVIEKFLGMDQDNALYLLMLSFMKNTKPIIDEEHIRRNSEILQNIYQNTDDQSVITSIIETTPILEQFGWELLIRILEEIEYGYALAESSFAIERIIDSARKSRNKMKGNPLDSQILDNLDLIKSIIPRILRLWIQRVGEICVMKPVSSQEQRRKCQNEIEKPIKFLTISINYMEESDAVLLVNNIITFMGRFFDTPSFFVILLDAVMLVSCSQFRNYAIQSLIQPLFFPMMSLHFDPNLSQYERIIAKIAQIHIRLIKDESFREVLSQVLQQFGIPEELITTYTEFIAGTNKSSINMNTLRQIYNEFLKYRSSDSWGEGIQFPE